MDNPTPLRIAVLGSTGSIGTQVLDVVERLGEGLVRVTSLAAQSNADLLIEQSLKFKPNCVCIGNVELLGRVRDGLVGTGIRVQAGAEGFEELAASDDVDRVVVSVAGTPGLAPTLCALKHGKDVALASKEVLVAAGHLVMAAAKAANLSILPIDSEHSAVFQCLNGERTGEIDKIFLTASGGAFRSKSLEELANVTPEEALAHPTWKMGKKVTIDSATLMNKGLEIIEAKWLFGVPAERVEVVIHPQSIVHSLVRFADGSVIGQLGLPDMRLPIQYALMYPRRIDTALPRLDMTTCGDLTFRPVDLERFECLQLAMEAARVGGTLAVAMNAADEVAVESFMFRRIGFVGISEVLRRVMESHCSVSEPGIEEIIEADKEARIKAFDIVRSMQL